MYLQNKFIIIFILNFITFIVYGVDKLRAKRHKYRISENILLIFGMLAPIGAIFGMIIFRHKTKKFKFTMLIPLFLIIWFEFFIKWYK